MPAKKREQPYERSRYPTHPDDGCNNTIATMRIVFSSVFGPDDLHFTSSRSSTDRIFIQGNFDYNKTTMEKCFQNGSL
jgi:hypothetical protein